MFAINYHTAAVSFRFANFAIWFVICSTLGWTQLVHESNASNDIGGHWEDNLIAGQQAMKIVFHFRPIGDGRWEASMDSPDQGAYRIPSSKITILIWNRKRSFLTKKLA
jgi:hypothetical protein